ncbi:hypothetical protein I7I53_08252 [Histoplasma capsulatum var. duboisii H88]|uniref:Uncharacterized protein n=1 Tax=Ajellomyces capsulatus (strain H88) TaxID=544711 RepID=A0A8A1LI18_AJEC8|nr:hypothetical protein I7I53_08252 [Histoplasma capsulatum var. duboisii H88]
MVAHLPHNMGVNPMYCCHNSYFFQALKFLQARRVIFRISWVGGRWVTSTAPLEDLFFFFSKSRQCMNWMCIVLWLVELVIPVGANDSL